MLPLHHLHAGLSMETAYRKPLPVIDALTSPYWAHAKGHRLAVQKCDHCGDRHFPPSPVCPECLADEQSWEVVSGRATLVSWASFHRAYWDSVSGELPYDVCVVQLEEGPLVVSNFAGPKPANVRMGLPLRAVFDDVAKILTRQFEKSMTSDSCGDALIQPVNDLTQIRLHIVQREIGNNQAHAAVDVESNAAG